MASAFVGRSRELERLAEASAGALVTLWGPGGVGKTRLAHEHASRTRARGRAVAWADLAGAVGREDVTAAIASALGVAMSAGDDVVRGLGRAASAQSVLLVLDNLEQLDEDARSAMASLADVVRADASAILIATSRELIGAPGETALAVAPLGEDDALALFEGLAGGGSEPGDPSIARSIVRRLDSLPLAIELAAARVPLLGVTELLARLDRKLDVLGTAREDRPARHATLRAAIAWSWDLLDEGERDALMACATFEAPFDAAFAEAVIGGAEALALDRLERLRARALVHTTKDEGGRTTLRLLESVRDFAREAGARGAEPEVDARRARHAAAVLARSEPLAESARCGRDTLAELETMRADLLAVLRGPKSALRSGEAGRQPEGHPESNARARAALALAALLAVSGPASAALEHIDEGLTAHEHGAPTVMLARLLIAKGDALRVLGRLAEARDCLSVPIAFDDEVRGGEGARLAFAEARRVRGSVLRALGRKGDALADKQAALAAYREIGDRAREGICLGEIGAVHQSEGQLAVAKGCHAEAIAIHGSTGCRRAEGVEWSYLAVATHRAGDPGASVALHEKALAIHREVGHRRLEGAELLHLGFVHHELGAVAAAREAFSRARRVLASAGALGLEAMALVLAGRLEVDAGDPTTALLHLAAAAQVAPPTWPRVAATRHLVEGHLAMSSNEPSRAVLSYEASLAASRDLEVGFEALTTAYLAVALTRTGGAASDAAQAHLATARGAVATLENPLLRIAFDVLAAIASGAEAPVVPAAASAASSEVRRALGLAGGQPSLVIDDSGKRIVLPDGRAIDLSRRKNVRLVLMALARARRDAPGTVVSAEVLLEAGWAGERMRADAATKRLHTAIWTLRTAGLDRVLLTEGEGYLLDPRLPLRLSGP